MKATIKPTEKREKLFQYLKPRVDEVEKGGEGVLKVELDKPGKLSRIPGIEHYWVDDEKHEGLGGKPIHRKAFFHIENREDAAKAFLATVDGYTLYISTEREWDLRVLRKYNSEIIQVDKEVAEELGVEKLDKDFNLPKDKLLEIYQEFLTE